MYRENQTVIKTLFGGPLVLGRNIRVLFHSSHRESWCLHLSQKQGPYGSCLWLNSHVIGAWCKYWMNKWIIKLLSGMSLLISVDNNIGNTSSWGLLSVDHVQAPASTLHGLHPLILKTILWSRHSQCHHFRWRNQASEKLGNYLPWASQPVSDGAGIELSSVTLLNFCRVLLWFSFNKAISTILPLWDQFTVIDHDSPLL